MTNISGSVNLAPQSHCCVYEGRCGREWWAAENTGEVGTMGASKDSPFLSGNGI
jgi:hypothetical protein